MLGATKRESETEKKENFNQKKNNNKIMIITKANTKVKAKIIGANCSALLS